MESNITLALYLFKFSSSANEIFTDIDKLENIPTLMGNTSQTSPLGLWRWALGRQRRPWNIQMDGVKELSLTKVTGVLSIAPKLTAKYTLE